MGILSNDKGFHFIHVYKTGGSSIKNILSRYGQSLSIVYPNFQDYLKKYYSNFLYHNPGGLYYHYTASQSLNFLGKDKFTKYYTFSVVRNPWDWMVSLYCYIQQDRTHYQHEIVSQLTFSEFLRYESHRGIHQSTFVMDERGNLLVDEIIKFENLSTEFPRICRELGISADLPTINKSTRKSIDFYYKSKEKDYVYSLFQDDIKLFDYSFEELLDRERANSTARE